MTLRKRSLLHLGDVLAVDEDAAAGRLVEAEQQAGDGGFAGTRGADDGHRMPGRHLEAHALEDRALRDIGEMHVLEAHDAFRHLERLGAWLVLDLGVALDDREHVVDIDQRLLDLAVEHAHEVQRDIELHQHGVDEHEAADGCATGDDVLRRQHHHDGHADGEDHRLSGIEHGERGIGLRRGLLVARHGAVVARGFPLLGAEIFDGLVVEERIHRLGVGVRVGIVHLPADRDPPLGRLVGIGEIDHHHHEDDSGIEPVELPGEQAEHEHELEDRREKREHHEARQLLDALAPALEHAGQAAGLALQVKAQGQAVHVLEGLQGELSHRMHGDLGEDAVAHLGQHRHEDAGDAVDDRQQDRRFPEP